VDSGLEGVEKPDPRIFAIAAERLAVEPARCAYVGDFHAIDVVGSRAAGMESVLMDPIGAWSEYDVPRIRALSDLLLRLPAVAPD
jgi:putative hydrolase of the HAD superfamily